MIMADVNSPYSENGKSFDYVAYIDLLHMAYAEHGVLLSGHEIELVGRMGQSLPEGMRELITRSKDAINRDAALQLDTLKEAEDSRAKLQAAYRELEEKNKEIEAQLDEERKFRLKEGLTRFQKSFALWLVIIVGITILLEGLVTALGYDNSSINNIVLLLIQTLAVAVGSVFANREKRRDDD